MAKKTIPGCRVSTRTQTCVAGGYTEYKCSTCGETKRDEISATGEHHFTVVKEVVAPTYTSEGYTIYKCETCDETEKRDVVPMLVPESNGSSSAVTLTLPGQGLRTSMAEAGILLQCQPRMRCFPAAWAT